MFRTVRRVGIWSVDHSFAIIVGIAALGVGTVLLKDSPAGADASSDREGEVALFQRPLATCLPPGPDAGWRRDGSTEGAYAHPGGSPHHESHVNGHID